MQKKTKSMKKVTGIGGIFFKCKDPQKISKWYAQHLGFVGDDYGTNFEWRQANDTTKKGFTLWSPFPEMTKYFEPSESSFMINFRVDNIEELVKQLKKDKIKILGEIESHKYGKFAHILDPEGNKIELWEPNDLEYEKIIGDTTK